MATQIGFIPIFVILAIIVFVATYWKTKSWTKVGYAFEALLGLLTLITASLVIEDPNIMFPIDLVALGILIGGIVSLFK